MLIKLNLSFLAVESSYSFSLENSEVWFVNVKIFLGIFLAPFI